MPIDGVKGRFGAEGERAHTQSHPPIILSGKFKNGNGELPAGQVLMKDAEQLLVPYVSTTDEVMVGVLDYPLDTESEAVGEYVAHGTVKARLLTKGNGLSLGTTDISNLYKIGVYPE